MSASHMWRPWSPVASPTHPLTLVHGEGNRVRDSEGGWYLDGIAGALNASCGHGHPRLIEAAHRQMARLAHYDLVNAVHPAAEWITERLAALLPGDLGQTLLVNSGSEATEAAVRIALEHWRNVGEPRDRVVTFAAGYHGSTALALALSGLPYTHSGWVDPFPVHRVALPGSARSARTAVDGAMLAARFAEAFTAGPPPAAVVVEPLLNVGGGIVLPPGLLARIRALCDQHGTLLVLDEVFCGFGRTGRMFGFDHDGVTPDIVTTSKGISGGYVPLGAVTTTDAVKQSFHAEPLLRGLRYGHTTGGHAVAAAVALAVLDVVEEEGLVANAAARGATLLDRLDPLLAYPGVVDVRGLGLVVTVESADPGLASAAVLGARARGLLVRQQGACVMVIPPLTLTAGETEQLADTLLAAFDQVCRPAGDARPAPVAAGRVDDPR
ncbi:aspartate aminotransferase family protein [Micromonospora sp. NPDC023956]|uniref:aminotransferase family protein n=1 Tax=Micromonospora sp. NPDC023956 TaxID=3155722 RepID=UPI0033F092C6